jgi:hypothetical protein
MSNFPHNLDKMSDDELLNISKGKFPSILSAKSTTTREDLMLQAEIILKIREKEPDKSTKKMIGQNWVMIILAVIAIVIALGGYFTCSDRSASKIKDADKPFVIQVPPK